MIYFIQGKAGGKVKIGRSKEPKKRLRELDSANPEPLKIIALLDADDAVEGLLHRAFNGSDSYGEWHSPSPAVVSVVEACEKEIDLSPLLESMAAIPSVRKRVKRHEEVVKAPKKQRPKRRMNISSSERKRRSDAIKKAHAEGKIGGRKYGQLGGRPRGS